MILADVVTDVNHKHKSAQRADFMPARNSICRQEAELDTLRSRFRSREIKFNVYPRYFACLMYAMSKSWFTSPSCGSPFDESSPICNEAHDMDATGTHGNILTVTAKDYRTQLINFKK
jgi:hypothetical protein